MSNVESYENTIRVHITERDMLEALNSIQNFQNFYNQILTDVSKHITLCFQDYQRKERDRKNVEN